MTSAPANETGSGSILGLAVIGAIVGTVVLVVPLYTGLSIRQAVEGSADAAALAAADVASGIAPGAPCATASEVAAANDTTLAGCRVDGLVVSVVTNRTFLGLKLAAAATAGPPDSVTN